MREALTLIPYKAAEERHWDEAEEDDEEDRPTDYTLRLWTGPEERRQRNMLSHDLRYRHVYVPEEHSQPAL